MRIFVQAGAVFTAHPTSTRRARDVEEELKRIDYSCV
jgi:hypothetical protein